MRNKVNRDQCTRCGLCIKICPNAVIAKNHDGDVAFIPERENICLRCGQCMAVCPSQAIQVDGLSYTNNLFDLPDSEIGGGDFLSFLSRRRSIRNFKDQSVSREMIQRVLDSIRFAPFGSHPEKVEITVVSNRSVIESALPLISKFLDSIVPLVENPVASFILKRLGGQESFNTIKNHLYPMSKLKNYKLEHGDRITRGAPVIIIFHAEKGAEAHTNNSLIYATYAMLQALALGLGATMVEIVPAAINRVKELRRIFQIPEDNEAIMSLVVGYPKYKYKRAVKRDMQSTNWIS